MLLIKVELLPGGDPTKKRIEEIAFLINDETGDDAHGNYRVLLMKNWKHLKRADVANLDAYNPDNNAAVWRHGEVKAFPRKSGRLGIWDLVFRALKACGMEERNA